MKRSRTWYFKQVWKQNKNSRIYLQFGHMLTRKDERYRKYIKREYNERKITRIHPILRTRYDVKFCYSYIERRRSNFNMYGRDHWYRNPKFKKHLAY